MGSDIQHSYFGYQVRCDEERKEEGTKGDIELLIQEDISLAKNEASGETSNMKRCRIGCMPSQ